MVVTTVRADTKGALSRAEIGCEATNLEKHAATLVSVRAGPLATGGRGPFLVPGVLFVLASGGAREGNCERLGSLQ